jgi:coenzyme Q-binding protein COQ10
MPEYSINLKLPWACEQLFDLAADIESYPEFLPGWKRVSILRRSDNSLRVEQQLGPGLLGQPFVSEAELLRPYSVRVHSDDGPFRTLNIHWEFEELDKTSSQLTLTIQYAMKKKLLERLSRLFFERLTLDVVDRFTKRARELYGPGRGSG